jgi:hypothetical protein
MREAVGYVRVSREKQGRSGLGLEAQQAALQRFAQTEGFEIAELFVEVESGKHDVDKRPVLAKALTRAKRDRAPILVAKLDRLSRTVHYISGLMKHNVPFTTRVFVWLAALSCRHIVKPISRDLVTLGEVGSGARRTIGAAGSRSATAASSGGL